MISFKFCTQHVNNSDLSEQLCQSKVDVLVVKQGRAKSLSLSGVSNCLLNVPGDHVFYVRFCCYPHPHHHHHDHHAPGYHLVMGVSARAAAASLSSWNCIIW